MATARKRRAPAATATDGRERQRLRTRKDLLNAAARLMKQGARAPTLEEVAEEAMVSRATAYRYFPNVDALLVEAPLDAMVPRPEDLFAGAGPLDLEARVDLAEAALHEMSYANERALRLHLAHTLRAVPAGDGSPPVPVRQNRRLPLIEAALAPARDRFDEATYDRLCAALALVFGLESMIVLTDVVPKPPEEARRIKSWMIRALVAAALSEERPQRARRSAARAPQRAKDRKP